MAKPILYRDTGNLAESAVNQLEWLSPSQIRHICSVLGNSEPSETHDILPTSFWRKRCKADTSQSWSWVCCTGFCASRVYGCGR